MGSKRGNEAMKEIRISDLLDVIHFTMIRELGKNEIALDFIQKMDYLIKTGQLQNYSVNETELWKSFMIEGKQ